MLFAALLLTLATAQPPPFNAGADRGVFVYGPLLLDFQRRTELMGRNHALTNCSTDSRYCADGELFNIVLPRFCRDMEMRIGERWRHGDLETTLIGQEHMSAADHGPPGPGSQLFYLHTNVRPDIVYAYSPARGVTHLYYDLRREFRPAEAVDFVAIARRGELDAFSRTPEARQRNLVLGLVTLDQFAACLGEEFRGRGTRER
jgi:hypothetical protein